MKHFLLAAFCTLIASTALANDQYLELVRSDLRTEKVAIITEVMSLDSKNSEKFWPIYRNYEKERSSISDKRIAVIKDFAKNYSSMDDAMAKDLIDRSLNLRELRVHLKRKYHRQVAKAIGETNAARFLQVENQLNTIADLQMANNLPLIQKGWTKKGAGKKTP